MPDVDSVSYIHTSFMLNDLKSLPKLINNANVCSQDTTKTLKVQRSTSRIGAHACTDRNSSSGQLPDHCNMIENENLHVKS